MPWVFGAAFIVGALCQWRFYSGWHMTQGAFRSRPDMLVFFRDLGFALLPVNVGCFLWFVASLVVRVTKPTVDDAGALIASLMLTVGLIFALWGTKEFLRPSRWRRVPRWVTETWGPDDARWRA